MNIRPIDITEKIERFSQEEFWINCIEISKNTPLILIFSKYNDNTYKNIESLKRKLANHGNLELLYAIIYEQNNFEKFNYIAKQMSMEKSAAYYFYKQNVNDVVLLSADTDDVYSNDQIDRIIEKIYKASRNKTKILSQGENIIYTEGKSCVYLIESPSAPNIIKIGYTSQNIDERLNQIKSSTGALPDLRVCALYYCDDAKLLERKLHDIFANQRISKSREFFNISESEITKYVKENSKSRIFLINNEGNLQEIYNYHKNKLQISNPKLSEHQYSDKVSIVLFCEALSTLQLSQFDYIDNSIQKKYFSINSINDEYSLKENFLIATIQFSHQILFDYITHHVDKKENIFLIKENTVLNKEFFNFDNFARVANFIDEIFDEAIHNYKTMNSNINIEITDLNIENYNQEIQFIISEYYILSQNLNRNRSCLFYAERSFELFCDLHSDQI